MRHARLLTIAILSAAIVAACTTASAGWTYAPAPSMTPRPSSAASAEPSGSSSPNLVTISALGIKYEQATVTAHAGTPFQIAFENKDPGTPHNVSIHQGGATGAELFKGTVFNGVATQTYEVPALDAGTYAFVCTVHPTMVGTLTVQ
jgi:Copper binding proteins, plastocyanin/azurin family.